MTKISALAAATIVNDSDIIPIVQDGTNKQATIDLVRSSGSRTITTAEALVQTDNLKIIYINSATAINITIDQLTADTVIQIINIGAGTVTFVAGSGVTISGGTQLFGGGNYTAVILFRTQTNPVVVSNSSGISSGFPFRSGITYSAIETTEALQTATLSTSTIRAIPWEIKRPATFDQVLIEVSTAAASTLVRAAIYADNGSGYPGALVANSDAGTFDSGTTGEKTASPGSNIVLNPGVYYIAHNSNGGPTLRAVARYSTKSYLGVSSTTTVNNAWSVAFAFAAMPATFPGSASLIHLSNIPLVRFRHI